MSFQLNFLGYYLIKSPQLKKQIHSVKNRNCSHSELTAQVDNPRWTAEVDCNCRWPPADGAAVRLRRTAWEDDPGGQRTAAKADVHGIVGRIRTSAGRGRGRPYA
jgi:hypothetical protein